MRGGGSQSATNFVMRLRRSKQASDRSQPVLLLSPLTASHRVPPLLSCHRDSKTRHCEGCDADFRPARPWSRFCGPARRLSAPIAALFTLGKILDRILSSMRPLSRVRARYRTGSVPLSGSCSGSGRARRPPLAGRPRSNSSPGPSHSKNRPLAQMQTIDHDRFDH